MQQTPVFKNTRLALIIIVFALTLMRLDIAFSNAYPINAAIPIIFDESHLDTDSTDSLFQFDHDNAFQKPLELLNQIDMDQNFVSDYHVTINKDRFTSDYFEGIGSRGILIMTLLDVSVGSVEGSAIKEWVKNGGSIFIATQPDYAGFSYCKVQQTNFLLKKLNVYDMFHLYQFEDSGNINSDELYDDTISHQFHVDGSPNNPWDIVVTDAQFSENSFGQEMKKGIDNVLLGVSSIEVNSTEYVGAYSWPESYSVSDVTNEERLEAESIPWLAGTTLGKGKVVLLGSTFPIADWTIYGTTLQFIDQLDNMRLWFNIINWLAETEVGNFSSTSISSSSTSLSSSSVNAFSFILGLMTILTYGAHRKRKKEGNHK
ncbi:MAG: hypothetical protein ACW98K_07645 [Candidatus Kariarchaeaceae archaeon]|jgi:hypothetical protein